jgi:hypothetical protein
MGSEMQPLGSHAQTREIQKSRVKKLLLVVLYGTGSLFYNYSANLF